MSEGPDFFDRQTILDEFQGSCPIFPLPNFVLFPKTGHQFQIFEPRYKEMLEDALDSNRMITVTLLKEGWEDDYDNHPPIHTTGTLAYVFESKQASDGNYNILLMGLEKVQINEADKTHSYRRGAMTILDEVTHWPSEKEDKQRLIDIFTRYLELSETVSKLELIDNPLINTQMLTNLCCALIPIPVSEQQKLLELPDVSLRLNILVQYIEKEIESENVADELKDIMPLPPDWN